MRARGLLLASIAALAACSHPPPSADDAAITVRVAPVRTVTFAQTLELSGNVGAIRRVTVGAGSAGTVVAFNVQIGDRVEAGQVLAQVDRASYSAALTQAQSNHAAARANESAARAQLAAAQTRLHLARITAARMMQLYTQGAISKQRFDETQTDLAAGADAVAQARAGVAAAADSARAALSGVAVANVPLEQTTVRAPFAGIVTARMAEMGAVVGAGSPIVSLEDESSLEIDLAVPEDALATLAPGRKIAVRVDALGARTIAGRLRAIVPGDDPSLRSALVKIALPPTPGLLSGMFARVLLPGATYRATAVPSAALVTRAGQNGVFLIRNGRAIFVPVQNGALQGRILEVRGRIAPGETVVVSGSERLGEGTRVAMSAG